MDKNTELTYHGLKEMKKNDFIKLFKKPAPWKKATAVLFLAKYKFTNGKTNLVAVPYKKYNEAIKCYKNEVKKDNIYSAKLTCLASLEQNKDKNGNITFQVTPIQGSMNVDFLQIYGAELFGKLKVGIEVIGTDGKMDEDDLLEVVEAAGETLSGKKIEKIVNKQAKRAAKAKKIQEKLGQFEKAIGKADTVKLEENLAMLKNAFIALEKEAKEDGTIDATEQKELDTLNALIVEKESLIKEVAKAKEVINKMQELIKQL